MIPPVRIRALTRRLTAHGEVLGRYQALAAGRPASFCMLRSAAGRVCMVLEPLVRIRGRGRAVRVEAGDALGARLLAPLADVLAGRGSVERQQDSLEFLPAPVDPALDEQARLRAPGPLDAVRALALDARVMAIADPRQRLVVGLYGYDLVDAYERLPAPRLPCSDPPLDLMLAGTFVEFDLASGTTVLTTLHAEDDGGAAEAQALGRLARLAQAFEAGVDPVAPASACTASVDLDDAQFMAQVARLQCEVRAGEVFQIVPSRAFSAPCPEPLAALRRLAALNPSAYTFHLRSPGRELFGCSPESALRVHGDQLRLTPVAGTRARGRDAAGGFDAERDGRSMAELHLDAKETAEHMMLVDLARNDLARVARPGTREVLELLRITRHSHVMHLASEVGATLAADLDALHALVACLNPGTLTGAPKLRAMELLRRMEPRGRGAYGGAMGMLRGDGEFDSAIVIRSAEVAGGMATVRAGAGVVLDSEPRQEAEETRRKAAAVLAALGATEVAA